MWTLDNEHRYEDEVKKSRFTAIGARVADPDQAMAFLESVRVNDATHNCWAYRIGEQYRFSDDGEPGGSAGRPILAAIEGQGLDHVMVVVVRYFGGTKLGVGGLVRAYGGTAAECLRTAPRIEVLPKVTAEVRVPFEVSGPVFKVLEQHGANRTDLKYSEDGLVLTFEIEEASIPELDTALRDATRGRVEVTSSATASPSSRASDPVTDG